MSIVNEAHHLFSSVWIHKKAKKEKEDESKKKRAKKQLLINWQTVWKAPRWQQ